MGDIQERSAKENLNSFERKTFVRKEKNDALDRYKGKGEKEQVMPHLHMRLFMIINLLFPVLPSLHLQSFSHLYYQKPMQAVLPYQIYISISLRNYPSFQSKYHPI